ncbi:hypothetical protein PGT21_002915 [Puccinia graminis f. sp. tritici]|uniref:Uncharacterized protein n=1 Tax=Puccinia graminis f. sp. tritici TaxID=56615 RepID=A0A5B0RZE2_PUCGR|nr:hypothetical protein PGT21_002915 [Puccinia graminis f. sp. tritici]KAA1129964.1 hypothetical protein PGTUg99_002683 [Puccinia graminis f. sp. tritici]
MTVISSSTTWTTSSEEPSALRITVDTSSFTRFTTISELCLRNASFDLKLVESGDGQHHDTRLSGCDRHALPTNRRMHAVLQ